MGAEPSHVFHIAKEALYDFAHGVKAVVVGDLFAGIALEWNDCQCSIIGNRLSGFAAAISLVGNDRNSVPSRLSRAPLAERSHQARGEPQLHAACDNLFRPQYLAYVPVPYLKPELTQITAHFRGSRPALLCVFFGQAKLF